MASYKPQFQDETPIDRPESCNMRYHDVVFTRPLTIDGGQVGDVKRAIDEAIQEGLVSCAKEAETGVLLHNLVITPFYVTGKHGVESLHFCIVVIAEERP